MALLTLVHSPLVGPGTWDMLAPAIWARGHEVVIPNLTGTLAIGPPYAARQVRAVAEAVGGGRTVLVGHSGAGPLLAAIGDALAAVEGYVFLDAGLPAPGSSWFDSAPAELVEHLFTLASSGWLPPWPAWWGVEALAELLPDADLRSRFVAGCPRLPVAMLEEVRPATPSWESRRCGYVRFSDGYRDEAERARTLGWPVAELAGHHLSMLTDPDTVAEILLDLADQVRSRQNAGR
jgi:pimeloyl-ACP methyl ester carboxylesterase